MLTRTNTMKQATTHILYAKEEKKEKRESKAEEVGISEVPECNIFIFIFIGFELNSYRGKALPHR